MSVQNKHKIRVHGDNILECENTLKLLATALNDGSFSLISGPVYAPVYEITSDTGEKFEIQLFPGYGRWNFPLAEYISSLGGMLREAPDSIVTRVETSKGKIYERPILALEFSGALPAGNNAWQRTGRALALAHAGIPYLYFAELGGQELDSSRKIKAARFPNPLVPFAYIVLGINSDSISLPIYMPSPSSDHKVIEVFNDCFGTHESIELVRGILLSEDITQPREKIEQKVLKILEVLSQQRKRDDILKPKEWTELYSKKSGTQKAEWLIRKSMPWNKKISIETTTSFKKLLETTKQSGAVAIGSKEMPICLIPNQKRKLFASKIQGIYKERIGKKFTEWIGDSSRPLVCVWITGFKPRGDDSRPDRGLVPLARMIFGTEDIDLLTVVCGPAKPATWETLQSDMKKLAIVNGLWEAIINLSDGILIDSNTSKGLKQIGFLVDKDNTKIKKRFLPVASDQPNFGEHDVDTVLHILFSHTTSVSNVYECMCNPPGGDWSGINILGTDKTVELRWTSLPRVSGKKTKRPDHLAQFPSLRILFSVESKDTATKLEKNIGPRLTRYVSDLIRSSPTAMRNLGEDKWKQYSGGEIDELELISGGAFRYSNTDELKKTLVRAKVDIVFGIEFVPEKKNTIIHVLANRRGSKLIPVINKLASELKNMVQIKIY